MVTSKKKKTTTITIDKDLHKRLKTKAVKEDKTLSDVVKEVVSKGLEEKATD